MCLSPAASAQRAPTASRSETRLEIEPTNGLACAGGDDVAFTARANGKAVNVVWTLSTTAGGRFRKDDADQDTVTGESAVFRHAPATGDVAVYGTVILRAAVGETATAGPAAASATITLGGTCASNVGGEVARATLGLEQIGAAGIESTQKYSFDFFISRPFPLRWRGRGPSVAVSETGGTGQYLLAPDPGERYFGPRARWWGNVRIGSYPQQVNAEGASFAKTFVTAAGKVTVNELVQTAEFTTGLEYRVSQFPDARQGATESSRQRFALMAFGGIGAVGPFEPVTDLVVFNVPAPPAAGAPAGSAPQHDAFRTDPLTSSVNSKYVAFRPQTADQFLEHYMAGLRLYTFYADSTATARPLSKSPATVEVSVGKNRFITPDGWAWHAAAYYPFAFGDRTKEDTVVIYFFGDVWMKLGTGSFGASRYELEPAAVNGQPVALSHPEVTIIPVRPNARDTYRIGLSLDLVKVWQRLNKSESAVN